VPIEVTPEQYRRGRILSEDVLKALQWIPGYGIVSRAIEYLAGQAKDPTASGGLVQHDSIRVSDRLAPYLDKLDAFAVAQGGRISWVSGYRTREEQVDLFSRWERGDPNVPFEPLPYEQSKHATGDAADGESSSTALALSLGAYAKSLGMGWSAHEPWHFEVK
jgi:LAS superfamily LD-carboxypeptidase LdcB